MAKKSKTQRAKASARRAERKATAVDLDTAVDDSTTVDSAEAPQKKGLFSRKDSSSTAEAAKPVKKEVKRAKKPSFISEVRGEMKRVTWPSRQDVLRWSGVVVAALVFFGVYVFVLDNWIVTPVLLAISSLGA